MRTEITDDTLGRLLIGRATEGDQMLAHNALQELMAPIWKPTSERLPAHKQRVLITLKGKRGNHIETAVYFNHVPGEHDDEDFRWQVGGDFVLDAAVLAWAAAPEPFEVTPNAAELRPTPKAVEP